MGNVVGMVAVLAEDQGIVTIPAVQNTVVLTQATISDITVPDD